MLQLVGKLDCSQGRPSGGSGIYPGTRTRIRPATANDAFRVLVIAARSSARSFYLAVESILRDCDALAPRADDVASSSQGNGLPDENLSSDCSARPTASSTAPPRSADMLNGGIRIGD